MPECCTVQGTACRTLYIAAVWVLRTDWEKAQIKAAGKRHLFQTRTD